MREQQQRLNRKEADESEIEAWKNRIDLRKEPINDEGSPKKTHRKKKQTEYRTNSPKRRQGNVDKDQGEKNGPYEKITLTNTFRKKKRGNQTLANQGIENKKVGATN